MIYMIGAVLSAPSRPTPHQPTRLPTRTRARTHAAPQVASAAQTLDALRGENGQLVCACACACACVCVCVRACLSCARGKRGGLLG